jgi:hypothetical protein
LDDAQELIENIGIDVIHAKILASPDKPSLRIVCAPDDHQKILDIIDLWTCVGLDFTIGYPNITDMFEEYFLNFPRLLPDRLLAMYLAEVAEAILAHSGCVKLV